MKAYVILAHQIPEGERYRAEYGLRANESITNHGGSCSCGGRMEQVEGDAFGSKIFVAEFPSYEAAQRWYHSREYQELVPVRRALVGGTMVIVEGVEGR